MASSFAGIPRWSGPWRRHGRWWVHAGTGERVPLIAGGISPAFTQTHARFRNDDGSQTTATWFANEDTNATLLVDTNYRIRIQIDETASAVATNSRFELRYSLNGGVYTAVSASSTVVRASASSQFADEDATTRQLTVPTGSFRAGAMDENDGRAGMGDQIDLLAGEFTEVEFCFQIRSADVVNADTIDFRAYRAPGNTTFAALNAYTVTLRATVSEGTLYTQSAAGTITSAGAVLKQGRKVTAGTVTSAGALLNATSRALAGTLTTAGGLLKRLSRALAGALTTAGGLAAARLVLLALAGTLTSAGALVKQTARSLTGTLTSSGALLKAISRALAGTLTSSGALASVRSVLQLLTATLTTAGTVTKRTARAVTAGFTPAGSLVKVTARALAATLTSAATLAKRTARALDGTVTAAGALARQTRKGLAATLTTIGALLAQLGSTGPQLYLKALTATLAVSGGLTKQTSRALTAALTLVGALLGRRRPKAVARQSVHVPALGVGLDTGTGYAVAVPVLNMTVDAPSGLSVDVPDGDVEVTG